MYDNARKALAEAQINGATICHGETTSAIIEALRPHLIPDGCVAVCEKVPTRGHCSKHIVNNGWECMDKDCPLKPKESK
jgi:hypothetical protein